MGGLVEELEEQGAEAPLRVNDTLVWREERVHPLGPFVGLLLVDMQEQIEELHDALRQQLEAEGVGVVRVYERAEWTGAFTYEVEVHLKVVLFWPAKGKTVEEVQAAIPVVWGYIVVVGILAVGWTSTIWRDIFRASPELVSALSIFGVALGLLALAFIVYQIQKSAPGGSHGSVS